MRAPLTPDRQLDLFGEQDGPSPVDPVAALVEQDFAVDVDPAAGFHVAETVDRLLMERGEVALHECAGRLLEDRDADEARIRQVLPVLKQAVHYALAQGLAGFDSTTGTNLDLDPSSFNVDLRAVRAWVLRASTRTGQSDLFRDGAQTVALNTLRRALTQGWAAKARAALDGARRVGVDDVDAYAPLIEALEQDVGSIAPDELLRSMQTRIIPLAARLLGPSAGEFARPLWERLARCLGTSPFREDSPDLHASHAWMQCGRWRNVVDSVASEADWLDHAVLNVRMARAQGKLGDRTPARRAWTQLFWRHPAVADEHFADACGETALIAAWNRFVDADLDFETRDFPAWLLVSDPQQREMVPPESAPQDDCGRAYGTLHRLLTSGDAMEDRKALHAARPKLLRVYLAARP